MKGRRKPRRRRLRNPLQWRRLLPAAEVTRLEGLYERARSAEEAAARAYARGDYQDAEDLDAEADEAAELLEGAIDELELEPAERGEDEVDRPCLEPGEAAFGAVRSLGTGGAGEPSLEELFVAEYAQYLDVLRGRRGVCRWWGVEREDAPAKLREILRTMASANLSFRSDVTDKELLEAAQDAYNAAAARRSRKSETAELKRRLMR